jgi:hypothetical protein
LLLLFNVLIISSQSACARKTVIVKLKKSFKSSKISPFRKTGQVENIVGTSRGLGGGSERQRGESDKQGETKV